MLTSSNQYLRPEYLTPLPTTLDAKKSPLALLAQTCSQIGADTPNSKLLQSAEKNSNKSNQNKSDSLREKSSPASSNSNHSINDLSTTKSSFKPYEISIGGGREKTRSPEERASSASTGSRVRTPVTSKNSASGARCGSNQSAASPRASPANAGRKTPASSNEGNSSSQETSPSTKSNETRTSTPNGLYTSTSSANSKSGYSSAANCILSSSSADHSLKDVPFGAYKPGVSVPISSAFLGGYGAPGLSLSADLMASSLLSQHHHALKSGGLSPYLSYARMKGPSGADSLVPVCRDPYCTGCSLSSHLLATSTAGGKAPGSCPAGCVQCDHASKAPVGYLGHSPAAAAYAHAQLAALAAASQLPYVCNWIAGDASYCGKRFSSSEELLQHLRTHTSVVTSEASSALAMMSPTGLPPTHPLLHRSYPTPPLSPLATARFHPYSKQALMPPSLASSSLGFPLGHPGLPPYFSPYSLYGPRLGAASGMHP